LLRGVAGATDVLIVTKPPQFGFHPTRRRAVAAASPIGG
jgi:hypothetical protein